MAATPHVVPDRGPLTQALVGATVSVSHANAVGSGFFIAPGLVITCAHVIVDPHDSARLPTHVMGVWRGESITLEVVPDWILTRDNGGPDLAILRALAEPVQPVPCLSGVTQPGDEMWAFGYPDGLYRQGDSLRFVLDGPSQRADGAHLYRATQGRAVPGFSGAPALNWRTGMVCGLIRFAASPSGAPPTIRLTPASVIQECYSEILLGSDSAAHIEWLALLDDAQLGASGSQHPGPWLRSYLEAVVYADNHRRAYGENDQSPFLFDVYQSSFFRDQARGQIAVSDLGIGERDLLVAGDPGAGKTSLLRWVRHHASMSLLAHQEPDYVPVMVQARTMTEGGLGSFPDAIARSVSDELGPWLSIPPSGDIFSRDPIPGIPWLLLVDGFDELVGPENRRLAIQALSYWCGRSSRRVLMTSRPLQDHEIRPLTERGVHQVSLVPFDAGQIGEFIDRWMAYSYAKLPGEEVVRRAEALQERALHGQIRTLAGIPLAVSMMCMLSILNATEQLPENRSDLYANFIDALVTRQLIEFNALPHLRALGSSVPGGADALEELLSSLQELLTAYALQRLQEDSSEADLAEFAEAWTENLRPRLYPRDRWTETVMTVLRQSGLVTQSAFTHQTLADFLVAQEVVREPLAYGYLPERVVNLTYLLRNRSLVSFLVAGWQRRDPPLFRRFCEILGSRGLVYREFFATLVEDGIDLPSDIRRLVEDELAIASNNPLVGSGARVQNATVLARMNRSRGVQRLRILALDPRTDTTERSFAMNDQLRNIDLTTTLVQMDPKGSAAVLQAIATDPTRSGPVRLQAACSFLQGDFRRACDLLASLTRDESASWEVRLDALRILAANAKQLYGRIAIPRTNKLSRHVDAVLAVSDVNPDWTIGMLVRLLGDERVSLLDRARLANAWTDLAADDPRPLAILESIAVDVGAGSDAVEFALTAIGRSGAEGAASVLLSRSRDSRAPVSVRIRSAILLAELRHPAAANLAAELIGPELDSAQRVELLRLLDLLQGTASNSVEYVVDFLRRISTDDRTNSDRSGNFREVARLLKRVDPQRCAHELERIVHSHIESIFRQEAEEVWSEADPLACGDHLVEVAYGRCPFIGRWEDGGDELPGSSRGAREALRLLSDIGDPRAVPIAEEVFSAARGLNDDLCIHAAKVLARIDPRRGADLASDLALDSSVDALVRSRSAMDLLYLDDSRASEAFGVIARDSGKVGLSATDLFFGVPPNMVDMNDTRILLAARVSGDLPQREDAVDQLLALDPKLALDLLISIVDGGENGVRAWAKLRLRRALAELNILHSDFGS